MESRLPTRIVYSIEIKRSNWLCVYLLVFHFVVLIGFISVVDDLNQLAIALTMISSSLFYYCRRYYWLEDKYSVSRLSRDSQSNWTIEYGWNSFDKRLILNRSYASQYCVILYFKGRYLWTAPAVFIMSDAVDAELFRQLQRYCRDPKTFQQ